MARATKRADSPDMPAPPTTEPGTTESARDEQHGSIAGHIVDVAGVPVAGATVVIVGAGRETVTNLDGDFIMLLVPPGRVELSASMEGYASSGWVFDVHAGTRHERTIVLYEALSDAPKGPRQPGELIRVLAQAVRSYFGIPASVTIAIYALESGWGEHLAAENNPFGIKAVGTELADENGFARFRIMPHAFQRFGQILATREPYRAHTERLRASAAPLEKRIETYVRAIAPHWAEDPKYGAKVMDLIRSNHLLDYDR